MATNENLHKLLDMLPESEWDEVHRVLGKLLAKHSPVLRAFLETPEDDERETEEERKSEVYQEIPRGKVRSEEHLLLVLLRSWINKTGKDDRSILDPRPNKDRIVSTTKLFGELKLEAEDRGMRWPYETPISLGICLKGIGPSIAPWFTVEKTRTKKAKAWRISPSPGAWPD